MKIEEYKFGSMKVGNKIYTQDLIIFPDKINPGWWRKQGHSLGLEDLNAVIQYQPQTLIVGTGGSGFINVPLETRLGLKEKNIELITAKTDKALEIFNEQIQAGKKVVGVFHLTC